MKIKNEKKRKNGNNKIKNFKLLVKFVAKYIF